MSLENKTGLLIGTGAIARGYAFALAEKGARLILISRGDSSDKLALELTEKVKRKIDISVSHVDVTDYGYLESLFSPLEGDIDFVVNGAGGNKPEASAATLDLFLTIRPEAMQRMLQDNLLSKAYSMQLFAKHLKSRGHKGNVVNITSMAGLTPLSKIPFYSMAYAGVENLTKSMAYVFGHYGLGRVNNVAVGFTIGEQNRKLLENADGTPTKRGTAIKDNTSENRYVTPGEVASSVAFLLDDDLSSGINGATHRVDAGFNLINLTSEGAGYQ